METKWTPILLKQVQVFIFIMPVYNGILVASGMYKWSNILQWLLKVFESMSLCVMGFWFH